MNDTLLLHPAERMALLGFSDIVKIRNRVLEMKARGERVLQLEGGEPFMPTPPFVKEAMKRAVDENHTRYAPSSGIPQLLGAIREKIATRNRIDASTDHLIVTSGGAHALFCAFQATVNPGDEVLFFAPYWTPIRDEVRYCGGVPVLVDWEDVDDLRKSITAKTRILYVNSPSNPTGRVLTRAQLTAIARLAEEHNLIVIADEAYEDLVYDGEHVSMASLPGMRERTITTYTFSKSFAMTGWRIGYLVAGEPFMSGIRKLVLNSVNGVSTPTQFAAFAALSDQSDYLAAMRAEYRRRRNLLVGGLRQAGFDCPSPAGAFYLFPRYPQDLGGDCWTAMTALLERTRIASVPGTVFGPQGEGHLRMSFSQSVEVIEEAVEALTRL